MGETQRKHEVQPIKAEKADGGRDLEALGLAEGLAHHGGEVTAAGAGHMTSTVKKQKRMNHAVI